MEQFGRHGTSTIRIGTSSEAYKNKLSLYSQACIDVVKEVHQRRTEAGLPEDSSFEDDVKAAFNWPTARDHQIPLPFPTRSFIDWIFSFFSSFPKAIDEVSSKAFRNLADV